MVSGLTCGSLIHFESIFVGGVRKWLVSLFCGWASSFSSTICWRDKSFPHCVFWSPLSWMNWPYKDGVISGLSYSIDLCIHFCARSYCFDYYRVIVCLEIWNCDTSSFVLFQDCFGHSGSLCSVQILRFFILVEWKTAVGILIGIALNLWVPSGGRDILILVLPIDEHGICPWICFCHLQFLSPVLDSFQSTGISPPWFSWLLGILNFMVQLSTGLFS